MRDVVIGLDENVSARDLAVELGAPVVSLWSGAVRDAADASEKLARHGRRAA